MTRQQKVRSRRELYRILWELYHKSLRRGKLPLLVPEPMASPHENQRISIKTTQVGRRCRNYFKRVIFRVSLQPGNSRR